MSFKEKRKEWRKRIVHLLVLVLILTSIPIVPVQAQTDVQSVAEMEQPSTSDGDAVSVVVTEEEVLTVSEGAEITAINAEIKVNTFYYESPISMCVDNIISTLEIIYNDGTVEEVGIYDALDTYGWNYSLVDADGYVAQQDENYKYPIGDYVCNVYVNEDVSCSVPFKVMSVEDVALELNVGDTISGLSGTDNYSDYDNNEVGYWLKLELEESGNYEITKSAEGVTLFVYPDGNSHGWYDGMSAKIYVAEQGTAYCYVKGSDTFDVTLTKLPSVTSISADIATETFYYELSDGYSYSGGYSYNLFFDYFVSKVNIILSDGTVETCNCSDEVWNQYDLGYRILDEEGNIAQLDENNWYSPGDYVCEVYEFYTEISCEIPIKIVSIEDVATELVVGETLVGLSGTNNYEDWSYTDGHWLKFELAEAGNYELSKTEIGVFQLKDPNGSSISTIGTSVMRYVQSSSDARTCYCYVKGSDTFDVTLTKLVGIADVSVELEETVSYYELDSINIYNLISAMSITYDDGTVETYTSWNEVWNKYGFYYSVFDEERNEACWDENCKYPAGKYILKICMLSSEWSVEIPIEVVLLEDIATELTVGGTVTGLSGTDDYDEYNHVYGHWLKMQISEPGCYEIQKNTEGTFQVYYPYSVYNGCGTSIHINIDETTTGTYYCYVKGSDTFDVTLTKAASVASISVEVASDTFYYEIGSINDGGVVSSVTLTLDDGTYVNCMLWDETWNDYGLTYSVLDADGNYAQLDENWKYPMGDYIFKIYSTSGEASCEIPVEVVSLADEATALSVGESITGLAGTINYDSYGYTQGHWIKLEITETGNYEIQKSVIGTIQIIAPDGMVHSTNGTSLYLSVGDTAIGTYYLYAKGCDVFDVTLVKAPEVVDIKAEVKRDTLYYEIEDVFIGTIFSSIELTFDDGSVETFEPWNVPWSAYGINAMFLDTDGNLPQTDVNYKYPAGNYIYSFSTSDAEVNCEVPVEIVSLERIAIEIADGETVASLSGTENYIGFEYTDGHWLKMEVTKPGRYELSKTADGSVLVSSSNAPGCNWNGTMLATIQASAEGTYYIYVKGSDTFDVTLTKLPDITAMNVTVTRDTFYREVEGLHDFAIIKSVELTIDDGTVEICKPHDNVWVDYGITCSVLDANGNYAAWDEDSLYPVGNYVCKVYIPGSEVSCEIPIKVAPIDDVVIELTLDETITGLTGTEEYQGTTYENGHWLKIELTEPGNYRLSKSQNGMIHVRYHSYSQGWGTWCENAQTADIEATDAGTYYFYVRGSDTFDVTISKIPDVVSISANVARDTFCYGLDGLYINDAISSIELTLDDGVVTTCDLFSTTWYGYGFQYRLLDAEGNDAQRDANWNYPVGDYTYKIYTSDNTISCLVPIKIVNLTDVEAVLAEGEAVSLSESTTAGYYRFDVTENGLYELKVTGETAGYCYARIYNESGAVYRRVTRYGEGVGLLGEVNEGTYYVKLYGSATNPDEVTLQINRKEDLVALEYSGEEIVFNYGEWGYKIEGDLSSNVSTRPETPNTVLSGNYVNVPITIEGTTEGGNTIEIPYRGYQWNAYLCNIVLTNMDESDIYTDHNGYIACGEYLMHVLAYGGAVLKIPFKVVGGPMDVSTLTYAGETQEFKYGTWGYSAENLLSGNQLDEPADANADLNQLTKGSNVLGLDFSVIGETEAGDTDTISYGSKLWNQYKIKTYFYQLDGTPVYTDADGYIPVGSYIMKCVAYNGVICEVPFEVYPDAGKVVEGQLGTAVDEMLDAAETLTDESLTDATTEVKKDVVTQLLEKVEEIYEEQDISEIGQVIAETAIELITKLAEIEKQIEELLSTSVNVEAQDSDAEDIELSIKNALLSVPAGENAEIRVSTAEVPTDGKFDKDRAKAIDLELFAKDEDKMPLRAPVVITMKVPGGISEHEKIVVHHYKDGVAVETIPVVLHGDGTMSFATGSFSTFVIANDVGGVAVSGTVSSFGDATEPVALSLVDTDGACVAETTSTVDTGMFQFDAVEQGSYTLVVEKTNHTTREYNITVADEEVVQDVAIYLVGDVSGDGKINAKDKRIIYNHIAGESVLTDYDFLVGDVSGDGKINAKDKRMIYNHIAGESLMW